MLFAYYGGLMGIVFGTNHASDHYFSIHVLGMVPANIFNGCWVFPGTPKIGKTIEIH